MRQLRVLAPYQKTADASAAHGRVIADEPLRRMRKLCAAETAWVAAGNSARIPALLLDDVRTTLLDPFNVVVRRLRAEYDDDVHTVATVLGQSTQRLWHPMPFDADALVCDHAVYAALVMRIDALERLRALFDVEADTPERLRTSLGAAIDTKIKWLLEYQDQHQALSLHIENTGVYDDATLCAAERMSDVSVYERLYPSHRTAFHWGSVPDLCQLVYYIPFWGEPLVTPFDNDGTSERLEAANMACAGKDYVMPDYPNRRENRVMLALVSLLRKTFTQPCTSRNACRDLINMFQRHPGTIDAFARMLAAFLLGVYPHSQRPAKWTLRRAVYRWIVLERPTLDELRRFLMMVVPRDADSGDRQNSNIVNQGLMLYVFKEALYFYFEQTPGILDVLLRMYNFDDIRESECAAAGLVRYMVNERLVKSRVRWSQSPWFDHVDDAAHPWTHVKRPNDYEALSGDPRWASVWFGSQNHICAYLSGLRRKNMSETFRPTDTAYYRRALEVITGIDERVFDRPGFAAALARAEEHVRPMMRAVFRSMPRGQRVGYEWMVRAFGVSLKTVRAMYEAVGEYTSETNRTKLLHVLNNMYKQNIDEFNTFRVYFEEMERRRDVWMQPLPRNMVEQQLRTLFRVYKCTQLDELPESAGLHYVCMHCREFKAYVVGDEEVADTAVADVRREQTKKRNGARKRHRLKNDSIEAMLANTRGERLRYQLALNAEVQRTTLDFLYEAPAPPRGTETRDARRAPYEALHQLMARLSRAVDDDDAAVTSVVNPLNDAVAEVGCRGISVNPTTGEQRCLKSVQAVIPYAEREQADCSVPATYPHPFLPLVFFTGNRPHKARNGQQDRFAVDDVLPDVLDDVVSVGDSDSDGDEQTSKMEKKSRRRRFKVYCNTRRNQCAPDDLVRVNMIGRMLHFFGRIFMLCPFCLSVTTYHPAKFSALGFSCTGCVSLAQLRGAAIHELSQNTFMVQCLLCPTPCRADDARCHLVYDDTDDDPRRHGMRAIFLCVRRHARDWLETAGRTLALSEVRRGVKRGSRMSGITRALQPSGPSRATATQFDD